MGVVTRGIQVPQALEAKQAPSLVRLVLREQQPPMAATAPLGSQEPQAIQAPRAHQDPPAYLDMHLALVPQAVLGLRE